MTRFYDTKIIWEIEVGCKSRREMRRDTQEMERGVRRNIEWDLSRPFK